jgi:PLP dependent protein
LREIRNDLARRYPLCSWADLSMGTSADFEVGVQEGATLVRVGQAILGPRVYRTELANN